MAKTGRKSKYETVIIPKMSEIGEALKNGRSIKNICDELNISQSTWYAILKQFPEFSEFVEKRRSVFVKTLYDAMTKRALGFQYVEKKVITMRDADGHILGTRTEETTKTCPGDTGALHLLLKNFDSENWTNDPRQDARKERELRLKEKLAEQNAWFGE